jgi:hypothetical protein
VEPLWSLWAAWRYGGKDPYRQHHGLDADYVSFEDGEAHPPPFPSRLQAVELAFARYSHITEIELHGGTVKKKKQ